MNIHTFDSKQPGEVEAFSIDFANILDIGEPIQSATVNVTVKTGTDATPNAMKVGGVSISGTKVTQLLGGGVDKVYYYVDFTAITPVQTLIVKTMLYIDSGT